MLLTASAPLLILPLLAPSTRRTAPVLAQTATSDTLTSASAFADAQAAVWHGNLELLQQILAQDGALAVASDTSGATLLHQAAFEGRVEVCSALLRLGADQTAVDGLCMRPLDWAILHSKSAVVKLLAEADTTVASTAAPFAGSLLPIQLAAAAGDADTLAALLSSGLPAADADISAADLARAMGHVEAVQLLVDSFGSANASMPAPLPFQPPLPLPEPRVGSPGVRTVSAADLAADAHAWDAALADSAPLLIKGLSSEWADMVREWSSAGELQQRWSELWVRAGYSPDALYQRFERVRSVDGEAVLCMLRPPSREMSFASFVDELRATSARGQAADATLDAAAAADAHDRIEHLAVQQSRTADLGSLFGQEGSALPPLADQLVRRSTAQPPSASEGTDGAHSGSVMPEGFHANLWACAPPKLSQLHYDGYDSLLLQLQGTKRFTLIDPTPICGLAPCPATTPAANLVRHGPGKYEIEPLPTADERATYDNFPLVRGGEAAHAPLAPLFEHARMMTVDVHAGDALLLPAFWYHEVESFCDAPDELNLAVNYWWRGGSAISIRHRILRERLRANPQ